MGTKKGKAQESNTQVLAHHHLLHSAATYLWLLHTGYETTDHSFILHFLNVW